MFVGGLDANVTDQDLRQVFGQYGELISVKIPVGKGCGFVQFSQRSVPLMDTFSFFYLYSLFILCKHRSVSSFHSFVFLNFFCKVCFFTTHSMSWKQSIRRAAAEEAIQKLHGTSIGQQTVRLSWGRSPANKQVEVSAFFSCLFIFFTLSRICV